MLNNTPRRSRRQDLTPEERAERERRRIRESLLDEINAPNKHDALTVATWGMLILAALVGAFGVIAGLSDMTPRYSSAIGMYGGNGITVIVAGAIASFSLFSTAMIMRAIGDIAYQQAITNAILLRQLQASVRQLDALHDTAQNAVSDAL